MPLFPATPQIKSYFGVDGLPLNLGFVFFGTAGSNPETNPLPMFWDAAGTIPAGSVFRTKGGYIIRDGTPANVFPSGTGDFSSTVYDSRRQLVYTLLNNVDFQAAGVVAASNVTVVDAGGFYTGAQVEAILAEIGATLAGLATGNVPTGATFNFVGGVNAGVNSVAPAGFVYASGRSIGNVASNATERNNADTLNLYTLLWNVEGAVAGPGLQLLVQESGGASVANRGVNAAADFAANRRILLPDGRGLVFVGKDNMGVGNGTAGKITLGGGNFDATLQFKIGGGQNHVLTIPQLAAHTHTQNPHNHATTEAPHSHTDAGHPHVIPSGNIGGGIASLTYTTAASGNVNIQNGAALLIANTTGLTINNQTATSNNAGLDTAHPNVQPSISCNVIIKL